MKHPLFATTAILISAMSAEAADMDGPLIGGFADSGASYEEAAPAVASPVVGYVEGELHQERRQRLIWIAKAGLCVAQSISIPAPV